MKCIIPNHCIKLFARSIHCLSKIGDELFLEALKDGLAIRTVNSSRSAYACFIFANIFFDEYDQGTADIEGSNPSELLKCKLTMKSCLGIFKSVAVIEKTVQKCHIEFKPQDCRLVFSLYCHYGIIKTHSLTYQECESLQAVFSKELCPNQIVAQSKILQDTVMNFPANCAEISLSVSPEKVSVKNYIDDEPDPSKVVHTEMTLAPEEFDDFQIGIDTQVTFCLKELRAVLSFSEFANQPISILFEQTGKPIVFSMVNDQAYSCDFVMATLAENDAGTTQQSMNTTVTQNEKNLNRSATVDPSKGNPTTKGGPSASKNTKKTISKNTVGTEKSSSINSHGLVYIDIPSKQSLSSFKDNNSKRRTVSTKEKFFALQKERNKSHRSLNISNSQVVPDNDMDVDNNSKEHNEPLNIASNHDPFFSASFPYHDILNDSKTNSQRLNTSKCNSILAGNAEDSIHLEIDNEDVLMGTPPAKKIFRSSFFADTNEAKENLSLNTTKKPPPVILAADTDSEDE